MRAVFPTIKCAVSHWAADQAATIGAALAFYCAFSIAPLLVILLATAGWIVGAEAAYGHLSSQLTALFGKSTAEILLQAMRSSQTPDGTIATIVSIGRLPPGAASCSRRSKLRWRQIWGARELAPKGFRGWVRARVLSFGLILAVGFLLLVSLSLSTALAALREAIGLRFTELVVVAGALDFVISTHARDRADRAHLSLPAGATPAVAPDPLGRARHGAVIPSRSLGDRAGSRPLDAAFGVRRRCVVRGDVALAVLLGADLPPRSRVHGVHRGVRDAQPKNKEAVKHATQNKYLLIAGIVVVVLIAARIALEPILLDYANDKFDSLQA